MITWSWNGRLVSAGAMRVYTDDRIVVREEGRDLLLREVSTEDRGEWSCTVQLKQEPVSLAHRLEILVAPSISLDHSSVSSEVGNTLKRGGSNMEQYGATLPHFLLVLL